MQPTRDELDSVSSAAADVISGGRGEDFSAFAESRWPYLVRLAYGLTGDRWTAEDVTQAWAIQVTFGMAGDCYQVGAGPGAAGWLTHPGALSFKDSPALRSSAYGCFPVSTPSGPEAIAALSPPGPGRGAQGTGYAVPVSPGTAQLAARLSDGSTVRATPVVVDGRKYAAVFVPSSRRLRSLMWLDAAGRVLARTTTLPQTYPYVEFQP